MASEMIVGDDGVIGGGGAGAGGDGFRESQRWTDKVYSRKIFKSSKANPAASFKTGGSTSNIEKGAAGNSESRDKLDRKAVSEPSSKIEASKPANSTSHQLISGVDGDLVDSARARSAVPSNGNVSNHVVSEQPLQNQASKPGNLLEQQPISGISAVLEGPRGLDPAQPANSINRIINNNIDTAPPSCSEASIPANVSEKLPIPGIVGVAEDSNHAQHVAPSNGVVKHGLENRIKINLSSKSKQEKRELRKNLENELNMVRSLARRIEATDRLLVSTVSKSAARYTVDNGAPIHMYPEAASVGLPYGSSRPSYNVSIPLIEYGQTMMENPEREKRTPKANQFYRNSDFLLANDKFPPENYKKSKSGKKGGGSKMIGMGKKFYKSTSTLLERLMKHKHGWVFNEPVNPQLLGLVDYFTVIKHPMDLGTIKSRLNSNCYKSPYEFADDVRLTFRNAMTYNPVGQDVHTMAELLAKMFEEKWVDIEAKYNRDLRYALDYDAGLPTPTSSRGFPSQTPVRPSFETSTLDRSDSLSYRPGSSTKPMKIAPPARIPAPKKPKAKDPNKRVMTFDEKKKLSIHLQELPTEKLDNIVQIIKKRGSALSQNDDEIEVDIDSVDNETLWELDRFVTNYKKSLSKNKRRAELAIEARLAAKENNQEKIEASDRAEIQQQNQAGDKNTYLSSPVGGENQGGNASSSSSSSSSSSGSDSSSSDSDTDSSSSDASDAENLPKT